MGLYRCMGRTQGALALIHTLPWGLALCCLPLAQSLHLCGLCDSGFALWLCSALGASWSPAVVPRSGD